MALKTSNKVATLLATAIAATTFTFPSHAYNSGYSGMNSGSGSGMGMGMGSGSGYRGQPGYYGAPGYGYPGAPVRPYGYQRPPMRPMPQMRPYGYQRPQMRPYGYQRPPMQQPYGYRGTGAVAPTTQADTVTGDKAISGSQTISIKGMSFQPARLTVKTGATITWTNQDQAPHTVTSMDSGPLASGTMNSGDRYSMTFEEPGTYSYYCKFHPSMRATIIVE